MSVWFERNRLRCGMGARWWAGGRECGRGGRHVGEAAGALLGVLVCAVVGVKAPSLRQPVGQPVGRRSGKSRRAALIPPRLSRRRAPRQPSPSQSAGLIASCGTGCELRGWLRGCTAAARSAGRRHRTAPPRLRTLAPLYIFVAAGQLTGLPGWRAERRGPVAVSLCVCIVCCLSRGRSLRRQCAGSCRELSVGVAEADHARRGSSSGSCALLAFWFV